MAIDFPDSPSTGQIHRAGPKEWYYDGTNWAVVNVSANSIATMITANAARDRANTINPYTKFFANTRNLTYDGPLTVWGNVRIVSVSAARESIRIITDRSYTGNIILIKDSGGNVVFQALQNGRWFAAKSPGDTNGDTRVRVGVWYIAKEADDQGEGTGNNTTTLQIGGIPGKMTLFEVWQVWKPPSGSSTANGINFGIDCDSQVRNHGVHIFYPLNSTTFHQYAPSSNASAGDLFSANTSGTSTPAGNTAQLAYAYGFLEVAGNASASFDTHTGLGTDVVNTTVTTYANSFVQWMVLP